MAETPFLLIERDGPVVIVTLNRPDTRNAISETAHSEEIADFCGIKKNLTTHVARHTVGTTVTLANNVPLQDVSVMLGHASTRMTQHYARVMNSSLKEAMNNVKERLEW